MASRLPLLNQNVWIVGGVGVVGRGIARSLLKAGATVIVNSRSSERLRRFDADIGEDGADRLVTVRGSLLPGYASKTVNQTLGALPLHHVVAHGALRFGGGFADETHSLSMAGGGLLMLGREDFARSATHLASLHFSAAQELIPRVQFAAPGLAGGVGTFTFVTGRGGGHPAAGSEVPAMTAINQYQVSRSATSQEPFDVPTFTRVAPRPSLLPILATLRGRPDLGPGLSPAPPVPRDDQRA